MSYLYTSDSEVFAHKTGPEFLKHLMSLLVNNLYIEWKNFLIFSRSICFISFVYILSSCRFLYYCIVCNWFPW